MGGLIIILNIFGTINIVICDVLDRYFIICASLCGTAASSGIHGKQDIQAIEAIQRTFRYKMTEVQHLNYWERLHELKVYYLQRRRERYIIIYIYIYFEDITAYGDKY